MIGETGILMDELQKVCLASFDGEIVHRGKGARRFFQRQVLDNLRRAFQRHGIEADITRSRAKIEVQGAIDPQVIARVFGVKTCAVADKVPVHSLDDVVQVGEQLWREQVTDKTFGIRCKRVGRHSFRSQDVAEVLGTRLNRHAKGVDLTDPQVWVEIEIREDHAYFITERIKGPGGLPIGVGDRALVLFSGGHDSPVATWQLARRGTQPHFLHFAFGSLAEAKPVIRVAQHLRSHWLTGTEPRFLLVPFAGVVGELIQKIPSPLRQVALRRAMYQAGERVARELECSALVTGEVLSQTTSQTLHNIGVEEQGMALPILRPLIAWNKEEILEQAKEIGTYELSLNVNELCSIAQGPVSPRVYPDHFSEAYAAIDLEMIHAAVDEAIEIDLAEPVEKLDALLRDETPTIAHIPQDAIVVGMSPEAASAPKAIPFARFREEQIEDNKPVIFMCKYGLTSQGIASQFRRKGLNAYSYEGGYERYRRLKVQ